MGSEIPELLKRRAFAGSTPLPFGFYFLFPRESVALRTIVNGATNILDLLVIVGSDPIGFRIRVVISHTVFPKELAMALWTRGFCWFTPMLRIILAVGLTTR